MRFPLLLAAILSLAPCQGGSSTVSSRDKLYVFHYENVLGTSLELKIIASSPAQSEQSEKAALAEIDRESHTYLLAERWPVYRRRDSDPGSGTELENLVCDAKGERHKG